MVNQISVHVDQIKHNHNVILASFQNQATKDETETLMDEVKKTSHRIHNGLKSEEGERGGERGEGRGRERERIQLFFLVSQN
jgi:hypothetical protein